MRTAVLLLITPIVLVLAVSPSPAEDGVSVSFTAAETAGIRRRSDVVSTRLSLDKPVETGTRFQVLVDDKPVPAQIFEQRNSTGQIQAVAIDLIDHFGPYETREYEMQYGVAVSASKASPTGFESRETDKAFLISNRDRIVWTIPKDLRGLLRFVLKPDVAYVADGSAGFVFRTTDGKLHQLAERKPTAVRVTRRGPIAYSLRYEYADWPTGSSSRIDLQFVRTKSWVLASWTIDGGKHIAGMGSELRLALEGREKLIDFAAGDFVYTTVAAGQVAVLEAQHTRVDRPWAVLRGKPDALDSLVVAPHGRQPDGLGGWAHVMDATRCTALAMNGFGKTARDRIEVAGDGRLLMYRDFTESDSEVPRKLEFGIHFVGMPVHIGARTSPQAMRNPIQVKWQNQQ